MSIPWIKMGQSYIVDSLRFQADFALASAELAINGFSRNTLEQIAPRSESPVPVVSIPGFMASDRSLIPLNRFLNRIGFVAQGWGLGKNEVTPALSLGEHIAKLQARLGSVIKGLADKYSHQVSLIGHSMGGVYAREIALHYPQEVGRVILLGAPTFHPYVSNQHNKVLSGLGGRLGLSAYPELMGRQGMSHWFADKPEIPCVAIQSPCDGLVDEAAGAIPYYIVQQSTPAAPRENLRVVSSHLGMAVAPWVLLAIADRLVQDKSSWCDFDPRPYFPSTFHWALAGIYPKLAYAPTGTG